MSEELAKSIVLASQRMEVDDRRMIVIIRYFDSSSRNPYRIQYPIENKFGSIEEAHNWLAKKGFQTVSWEENSHWMKILKHQDQVEVVGLPVMIMEKRLVEKN